MLYLGTSGWAYREWKPLFYPGDLPQTRFLEFYSGVLTACEVNATFYRLQSEKTFARWNSMTPASFRFAVKAHRRLTHGKNIAPGPAAREFLDTFLKSVHILGSRLGPVLFQFPPYRKRDDEGLGALLDALPPDRPYAFEFRDDSWNDDAVTQLIAAAGGTVCFAETKGEVPAALPPGPIGYVRLRHDAYTDETRATWLELLRSEAKERDVYVFTKHEGGPPDDPHGGVGLAGWLANTSRTQPSTDIARPPSTLGP